MQGLTNLACKQKFMGHTGSSWITNCTHGLYKLDIWVSKINYTYTLTTLCFRRSNMRRTQRQVLILCEQQDSLEAANRALTSLFRTACCCEHEHLQELFRRDSQACVLVRRSVGQKLRRVRCCFLHHRHWGHLVWVLQQPGSSMVEVQTVCSILARQSPQACLHFLLQVG